MPPFTVLTDCYSLFFTQRCSKEMTLPLAPVGYRTVYVLQSKTLPHPSHNNWRQFISILPFNHCIFFFAVYKQSPTGSSPNALPSRTLPPSAISGVQVFASSLTPPSLRPPSEVSMGDLPSYQPWKALNEFAMHNDMDQGPFQQLVSL